MITERRAFVGGKNGEMFKESRISPTVFVHKSGCVWENNLREMIFVWEIYFRWKFV